MIKLYRPIKDWRTRTSVYEAFILHVVTWIRRDLARSAMRDTAPDQSHDVP